MTCPRKRIARPTFLRGFVLLLLVTVFALFLAGCGKGDTKAVAAGPGGGGNPNVPDPFEAAGGDDTPATASVITIGQTQTRTAYPAGDVDWVRVDLTTGVTYEFSANHLAHNGDVRMELYSDPLAAPVAQNDDCVFLDACIQYPVAATGTYYVRVHTYRGLGLTDIGYGSTPYTLSARIYVDGDGDSWSNYYDCNDAAPAIGIRFAEVPGDGIDQDCDGVDALDGAAGVADAKEVDNTFGTARPMAFSTTSEHGEFQYHPGINGTNIRSLHNTTDEDWFSFTVPAYGASALSYWGGSIAPPVQAYEPDGTTPAGLTVFNVTASAQTYYLKVGPNPGGGGWYRYHLDHWGVDQDGDGYYNQDWASWRDCNDTDPLIHGQMVDTPGDGIDSNCDGNDDT